MFEVSVFKFCFLILKLDVRHHHLRLVPVSQVLQVYNKVISVLHVRQKNMLLNKCPCSSVDK